MTAVHESYNLHSIDCTFDVEVIEPLPLTFTLPTYSLQRYDIGDPAKTINSGLFVKDPNIFTWVFDVV